LIEIDAALPPLLVSYMRAIAIVNNTLEEMHRIELQQKEKVFIQFQ
jgi:hypothetical protein